MSQLFSGKYIVFFSDVMFVTRSFLSDISIHTLASNRDFLDVLKQAALSVLKNKFFAYSADAFFMNENGSFDDSFKFVNN